MEVIKGNHVGRGGAEKKKFRHCLRGEFLASLYYYACSQVDVLGPGAALGIGEGVGELSTYLLILT